MMALDCLEDQEAYALRVFQRFPELLQLLGDPKLPEHFDVSRSHVELREAEDQRVLRAPWKGEAYA